MLIRRIALAERDSPISQKVCATRLWKKVVSYIVRRAKVRFSTLPEGNEIEARYLVNILHILHNIRSKYLHFVHLECQTQWDICF